jgi:hypothetical protein
LDIDVAQKHRCKQPERYVPFAHKFFGKGIGEITCLAYIFMRGAET